MSNKEHLKFCILCDKYFKSYGSDGKWDCLYHPENLYYDNNKYKLVFSCCSGNQNAKGCVPHDHMTTADINIKMVKISISEFKKLETKPPKERVCDGELVRTPENTVDEEKSYIYIKKHK